MGDQASKVAEEMQEKGDYARALYLHGLAVETAEALADFWHARVRSELGHGRRPGQALLARATRPGRSSTDQRKLWKLLDPERNIGVSLTSADQMVPEQSTSAIVLHHPEAVYYTVLYVVAVLVSAVFLDGAGGGRGRGGRARVRLLLRRPQLHLSWSPTSGTCSPSPPSFHRCEHHHQRAGGDRRSSGLKAQTEEMRSSLLSSVSHDLRTPLAAITGAATTLRDEGVDEDTRRELVEAICEEAERLERLVANLLDMTRLEAGVMINREWIPVEEVVGAALTRLERQLEGRADRTRAPAGPSAAGARRPGAAGAGLRQPARERRADTPRRAAPECGVRRGRGRRRRGGRRRGPGSRRGEEERVFEKFYRGRERGSAGGAGLGLAISRGIVEAHGGTVGRVGPEGGGAVFTRSSRGGDAVAGRAGRAAMPTRRGNRRDRASPRAGREDEAQMRRFLRASLGAQRLLGLIEAADGGGGPGAGDGRTTPSSSSSTSGSPTTDGLAVRRSFASGAARPSSSSRRAGGRATRWRRSTRAPTTTSPSPSA